MRSYPARRPGGVLETQYLTIADAGAIPCVLSQPTWLWGAEHGVNAHHVAIGNEKIWGTSDPFRAEPALIGMDLVRLGLERGRSAEEAIDVMTELLERHGQGGVADSTTNEPYWSSFLVVDPHGAWVLETCSRTWAARRTSSGGTAISNRITIRDDWDRASPDVENGADFDDWRQPDVPTGHADRRSGASRAFLERPFQIGKAEVRARLQPCPIFATTDQDRGAHRFVRAFALFALFGLVRLLGLSR